MKKYAKIFTFALFTFFMSSVSVFAREMTIDELGEEASKIEADAGYVYVLGEYAFTSNYDITQEALIIAATSVKLEDPTDLSQANIYQIVRQRDAQFKPIGWEKGENVLGKKDMPTKVNVKYIDMHRILETSEATISADVEDSKYSTYKSVLKDSLNFTTENFYGKNDKVKIENNKVTGLLLKKSNTDLHFNEDDNKKYADTKYYFAAIVEVPEANENTIITITNLKGETKKATWSEFDVQSGTPGIVILFPIDKKDWEDSADKQITISVDVDGDIAKNEYAATEYKLDLSELKFQQESKMDLTTKNLPEADVKSISSKWGYNKSTSDTYNLENVDGTKYKLTGTIVQQKINDEAFPEDERTDFYFLFNIGQNIDKNLFTKATVTFPGDKSTKTTTITDETGVTILFSTKEDKKSEPIEITVDLDGDGDEYSPVTYTIDLSDVIFEKSSKFSVLDVKDGGLSSNPLESTYGWKQPDNYSVKFDTDGTTVKVTGLLPILETFEENKNPFGKDDTTGYYLPFVIKTDAGKKSDNTGVTVQFIHDGEDSKTFTADNFDGDDVLYILRHLDKDAEDKTFKIVVDMDGDGTGYAPYEMTFDWSELKLQERSTAKLKLDNASEEDKNQLTGWGYSSDYNNLAFDKESNSVKLTGTMKEQVIGSDAFGKGNENGYYFDFTFEIPDGVDRSKVKIARLNDSTMSGSAKKDFETSEWTNDGKLTILFRFPEDPKCEEKDDNCKLYYKVDFDGDGSEYLPTLYEIDYSEVTFKKSSLVNIDPVASGTIADNEEWNGFEEGSDYKVEFDKESSTFKVTGLITIFDDDWTDSKNPFGTDAYEYYLAFKLSKAEADGDDTDTIVKFLTDGSGHGDKNTISQSDFGKNKSIYVLKYLNPNKEYDNKKFTITVDFDDNGEEYEPYTITIDWSELDFQYKTKVADTIIVNPSATSSDTDRGYISDQNRKDIEKYGYDFANVGNITIDDEGLEGYKLTGTIKEQDVENGGFEETTGYYVPVKIYGPTIPDANGNHYLSQADGRKKWTVFLHDEKGNYREITPSQDDYNNGYIVVLFKLKDDDNKKITYKIDWDGSKGNVFLEQEVTISYGDLEHQALNTITYNYKDAEGKDKTESTKVYQNEEATLKDITNIDSDYRKFDGWYKSDNSKISESTLTISDDKDETLTAHWTLDADAFIKAVMEDLNAKEETSEKFNLTMDDATNTITIDVEDSRVLLSEMNDTNIPGAIAYILQKGEITGVTLSTGDKKVEFTKDGANNNVVSKVSLDEDGNALKEKIKQGAQALFKEVLSEEETTYTLSKMALNEKDFTLEISSNDDSVTLVDSANKTYTFKFETEAITVTNESELEAALKNSKISHLYLGDDIEVEKQHDVNRAVTINGGKKGAEGSYKLTLKDENKDSVDSIFKVSASGVTIDNIELSKVKNAIVVDGNGAELKTTGLKLSEITESGIKTIQGNVSATDVQFTNETHDIPTAKVVREQKGQRVNANVSIANATKNDPTYIGIKEHDKLWCADEGSNYGKEDDTTVQSCKLKSRSDEFDSTWDTYYYINDDNVKEYVIVNFMESFVGGTMGLSKIYEKGQNIDTFDEYIGKVKVQDSKTSKEYYFVGYGTGRKTTSDITSGLVYFKNLMDLTKEKAEDGYWHFAYYAERDDSKYVTLDESANGVDGYSAETKYYTYKFKDTESGMTIGQLKTIDKDFAKIWDALNEKAKAEKKAVNYENNGKEEAATDNTLIDKEIKLKISNPTMG